MLSSKRLTQLSQFHLLTKFVAVATISWGFYPNPAGGYHSHSHQKPKSMSPQVVGILYPIAKGLHAKQSVVISMLNLYNSYIQKDRKTSNDPEKNKQYILYVLWISPTSSGQHRTDALHEPPIALQRGRRGDATSDR